MGIWKTARDSRDGISENDSIRNEAKGHYCYIVAMKLAKFYSCPKDL